MSSQPNIPTGTPTPEELQKAHETIFAAGLAQRRAVAGPAYVEQALAKGSSSFHFPLQQLVTETAWGSIWTRPGLELKTRSLLNLAMMAALNRGHELAIHVRGAVRNGCTEVEIRETLLQATVYCGMPSGVEGFKIAEGVINEMKAAGEGPAAG